MALTFNSVSPAADQASSRLNQVVVQVKVHGGQKIGEVRPRELTTVSDVSTVLRPWARYTSTNTVESKPVWAGSARCGE